MRESRGEQGEAGESRAQRESPPVERQGAEPQFDAAARVPRERQAAVDRDRLPETSVEVRLDCVAVWLKLRCTVARFASTTSGSRRAKRLSEAT